MRGCERGSGWKAGVGAEGVGEEGEREQKGLEKKGKEGERRRGGTGGRGNKGKDGMGTCTCMHTPSKRASRRGRMDSRKKEEQRAAARCAHAKG